MKNVGIIECGNIPERTSELKNTLIINFVACADINLDLLKKQLSNLILFLYQLMKYLMIRM